ncbi:MAG: phage virion morphogenesis protein [Anaerolineae bacterium]|nr:phage virion morphogenesis protein [Anaerolineae bacterium]
MKIKIGLVRQERWRAWWRELENIGLLSNREAEIVADTARRGIAANFEREAAPSGLPWVPLRPMTQAERARGIDERGIPFRVGRQHPILKRTGDLKESFTNPRHPRNVTVFVRAIGTTLLVLSAKDDPRTPDRIRRLHAGGMTDAFRYVPPRPFIGLSEQATAQVESQARQVVYQRAARLNRRTA